MVARGERLGVRELAVALAALALLWLVVARPAPPPGGESAAGGPARVATSGYGELPLSFEPNSGRYPASVDYVAGSPGGTLATTERGISFTQRWQPAAGGAGAAPGGLRSEAVTMRLRGGELSSPRGLERLPGVVNDLRAGNGAGATEIPTFGRVRYAGVYPGVDLELYGRSGAPEYDFRLAPGADPSRIALDFAGADSLRLSPGGDLIVREGEARWRQRAPVAYQRAGGERVEVRSRFVLDGNVVSFELGPYERSRPLVIDPLVLVYSTYLGGGGVDLGGAIAVDSTGAAYVAGSTFSTDFDVLGQIEGDSADMDVVVSKLNPAGNALVYSTYIGGGAVDGGAGIAVDAAGAAYVVGETQSTDFNTVGAIEGDSGGPDVFVSKLNPAGNALVYSTYLGGSVYDSGFDIAVDAGGAAFVVGETLSTDFDSVGAIEGDSAMEDVFVSKLNPAGNALVYSTYIGGNGGDGGVAIALDGAGAAYVTGLTGSTDFDTVGAIEGDSGGADVFVSKLGPAGNALVYSTYLGGGATEIARGIAVDPSGAAYIAGNTASTDFDTVAPIDGDAGGRDAFVSKLQPAGNGLVYSTYLSGSSDDEAEDIALDSSGAAYVVGDTASPDFDTVGPIEGDSGQDDAFVAKLAASGSALDYSTYLGGDGLETTGGIAVDAFGSAYVVGDTRSTDFDTVGPIEGDSTLDDLFIAKLDGTAPETTITKGPKKKVKTKKRKRKARVRFEFTASEPGSSFECQRDSKPLAPCTSPKRFKLRKGKHRFTVRATDAFGNADPTPALHTFKVKRRR